jgi:hypothetical protein
MFRVAWQPSVRPIDAWDKRQSDDGENTEEANYPSNGKNVIKTNLFPMIPEFQICAYRPLTGIIAAFLEAGAARESALK